MAVGIRRHLKKVLEAANKDISNHAKRGFLAGGLANEGYAGGYAEAVRDIGLALSGIKPNHRFWDHCDFKND